MLKTILLSLLVGSAFLSITPYTAATIYIFNVQGRYTDTGGINNQGQVVGSFFATECAGLTTPCVSYRIDPDETITTFTYPGAVVTSARAINDAGLIAGFTQLSPGGTEYGFLRDPGGTFTTVSAPGGIDTIIFGINSSGRTVGYFNDSSLRSHAFLRDVDGTITTFNVPGGADTIATGINDVGQIVGWYYDAERFVHGFLRDPGGEFTLFDYPDADTTYVWGINNLGEIVGYFSTRFGSSHGGFVRGLGDDGQPFFQNYDIGGCQDTGGTGINDSDLVVGFAYCTPDLKSGVIAALDELVNGD